MATRLTPPLPRVRNAAEQAAYDDGKQAFIDRLLYSMVRGCPYAGSLAMAWRLGVSQEFADHNSLLSSFIGVKMQAFGRKS